MSKKLFLCLKISRNFFVKVNKAKGMPVLSRKVKIQYPREKLISYKSPALSKRQPNLFQSGVNWTNKQKPFSNRTPSRE